jgi:AcrR family transcriptional regulator
LNLVQKDDARARIVEAAIDIVAEKGLAALSVRDLAAAIGKSTTVIFNLFQTKAGLLAAVVEAAMEEDRAFHCDFFDQVGGLALDRHRVADITVRYILTRAGAGRRFAWVWGEFLIEPEAARAAQAQLLRWSAMRRAALERWLARDARLAGLSGVYFHYLLMEEFYAGALSCRLDYELLLRESLEGMLAMAFDREAGGEAEVARWFVDALTLPEPPSKRFEPGSLKIRLLDIAADQILERGIGAVTNRTVTQQAGTSTSTILYHFADMRSFLVEAIWHSVFREIPDYLDTRSRRDRDRPADLQGLAALLAPTLAPGAADDPASAGFYVKYSRLIAQICLMARRDPAFESIVMLLRGPEGGGTYARRDAVWPAKFRMTRLGATRFALWIKGCALLTSALPEPDAESPEAQVRAAALALIPIANDQPNR